MKKLAVLLTVLVLAFTIITATACNKGKDPEAGTSESAKQSETLSSSQVTSRKPRPSNTSEGESYNPPVNSGDSKPSGTAQASGDSYTVPTTPTEGLPQAVADVVSAINRIGTVSAYNYEAKSQFIQLAETRYNALTAQEKAQVPNYTDLQNAKNAYNGFVRSVAIQYVNDFKKAVDALKGFEDDSAFKSKVEVASNAYELIDDAYKNEVSAEYIVFQAAKIHASVNDIPAAASITGNHYIPVDTLKKQLASLSQNIVTVYPKYNADKLKLDECYNKIMQNMIEKAFIVSDLNGDGIMDANEISKGSRRTTTTDGFFTVRGGGTTSGNMPYTDSKNPSTITLKNTFTGTLTFNAPASGIMTYYARMGKDFQYRTYIDGEEISVIETHASNTGEQNTLVVEIPRAGTVTVKGYKISSGKWEETSDGGFFAVKYLYSTL